MTPMLQKLPVSVLLLEVYPLGQALERDGDEEQQQVTAEEEEAAFASLFKGVDCS